jgi:hypothetical protein
VRALVRVRSDHNHPHRPFVESLKRTFGGQLSVGAVPRSYQVTPKVLGRRRATEPFRARPTGRRAL